MEYKITLFQPISGVHHGIVYCENMEYFFYIIFEKDKISDFLVHKLMIDEESKRLEHVDENTKFNLLHIIIKHIKYRIP